MIPENYSGLVLFGAVWAAEPCASVKQILKVCEASFIEILDEEASGEFEFDARGVEMVPCLIKFEGGKEVGRVSGVNSREILSLLSNVKNDDNEVYTNTTANTTTTSNTTNSTNSTTNTSTVKAVSDDYLKGLVGSSKLMLFIKGTPNSPRCGFTSQLLRLFSENGLKAGEHFDTFDILSDQTVREELKRWAEWPTYPQIYWKGELMGGLDIVKEMFSTGQMDEIIKELKN